MKRMLRILAFALAWMVPFAGMAMGEEKVNALVDVEKVEN